MRKAPHGKCGAARAVNHVISRTDVSFCCGDGRSAVFLKSYKNLFVCLFVVTPPLPRDRGTA